MAETTPRRYDPCDLISEGARRNLALAAIEAFGRHGFDGANTRNIAEKVGMSSAGLYVYYPSKAKLLYTIAKVGHDSVLNAVNDAVKGIAEPDRRVHAWVSAFTCWHADNHALARVNQYELRSLEQEDFEIISAIRRKTEAAAVREMRVLAPDDPDIRTTARAILSMGIDVARWYNPATARDSAALGDLYGTLALRMLRSDRTS
jgi:AcrR family transcriptional regulator